MPQDFLFGLNQIALFLISLALLYLFAEAGYRYGIRFAHRTKEDIFGHVATIEAALLGLMALLLGFAFSMAMARYDARKQIIMNEVNDLQTTFMRSQLLPANRKVTCAKLLHDYLTSRIMYYRAGTDEAAVQESLKKTKEAQVKLWNEAVLAARENSTEVVTGYFIKSLNELIDDHTKRLTAMENHVPQMILLLLFLVACMTMVVTGYSSGLRTKRLKALRCILVVLIAATLSLIIDLDRPRRGLIKISEAGMMQLQSELDDFVVK